MSSRLRLRSSGHPPALWTGNISSRLNLLLTARAFCGLSNKVSASMSTSAVSHPAMLQARACCVRCLRAGSPTRAGEDARTQAARSLLSTRFLGMSSSIQETVGCADACIVCGTYPDSPSPGTSGFYPSSFLAVPSLMCPKSLRSIHHS